MACLRVMLNLLRTLLRKANKKSQEYATVWKNTYDICIFTPLLPSLANIIP